MSAFLSYVFLGLSLAAPIGPINAAQLDKGIKSGFFYAWLVGVGAVVADAIYMFIVYLGVVRFINTPLVKTFLWLFGSFVLIYTGVESLLNAGNIVINNARSKESMLKSFVSGFFMSLLNPLSILFWLGIYGSVLAEAAAAYDERQLIVYSSAIFTGLLLWDVTMAAIASTFRRYLTARVLSVISLLSGLSLVVFGVYFGFQGIKTIFL
ncbi:LysE family transporter [Anoxybacteroides tepidamans]|uniref:LysE family transporter n=1 Tax=Anoxybacteroides tepidamans TaxID=265948 RepID=UPI0004831DD1|nr:LysE family transporter [Anoxybacillus tepidamans]